MGSGGGGRGDAEVGFPSGAGGAEGEFRTAKTSVWWDIENCQVPKGWDAHTVAKNISTALANMGYRGMVSISAYGDTNKIAFAVQQALCSTGISLNHVPAGVKDASDKKILVDMLFWAVDNPPPANYLLISGDRDFSNALHQLRMRRYNVLLAHAPNVSQALVAAAKCVWLWTSLLAGDLPLNNESSRNSNISSNSFSCAEPSRVAVSEPRQQMVPPENIQTNQKGYANGKFEPSRVAVSEPRQQMVPPENIQTNQKGYTNGKFEPSRVAVSEPRQQMVPPENIQTNQKGYTNGKFEPSRVAVSEPRQQMVPPENIQTNQKGYTNGKFEPSRVAVSEPRQQMVPPENIQTNQKGYTNGKFDKRFKGKQTSTGGNGLKHSNVTDKLNDGNSDNVLKSNHMQWPNQVLNSVAQTSQPLECKQLNIGNSFSPPIPVTLPCEPGKLLQNYSETKLIKEAPHKFFGALNVNSGPMTKVSSSMPDYPPNSYPVRPQPPQLLRSSDLHSTQTTLTSGNLYEPVSSQQPPKHAVPTPFNSSPSAMLPDMNRLNISEYPRGVNNTSYYQNPDARPGFVPNPLSSVRIVHPLPNFAPSFPQRPEFRCPAAPVNGNSFNNGGWGMPACPQPSSEVQFHIGNILRALYILKTDKMMPTEANIADCIHYGEINLPNFNVSLGLDHAIRHNMIVKHNLGASLPLYIGKNDKLWKCVNIMDWNDKHPKETWDAIQTFITSTNGRAAILATQCRYQAAIILKKNCLKNQVMGNVLQILNMSIHNKKWITPHFSGWQPLSIKLPVSLDIDI